MVLRKLGVSPPLRLRPSAINLRPTNDDDTTSYKANLIEVSVALH